MHKFYIFLIALFMAGSVAAQSCLPEGITFSTQAQINNFQTNYPNCTQIEGGVTISGSSITNLNGLSVVTSIGGDIQISHNSALTSLTGLDNVEANTISGLYIYMNPTLSTCAVQSICDYLAAPNGEVEIHDNATGCNSEEEVKANCKFGFEDYATSGDHITIYPNPSSTTITISTNTTSYKNTFMTLYSVNRKQLIQRQITEQQTVVDVSGLTQGVYFVRVADERKVKVGKIIRQ